MESTWPHCHSSPGAPVLTELAAMAAGGFHYWTVLKDDDAIGMIDLSYDDGQSAWTGFAFRRDIWGHGFAREALGVVIGAAFGPLRLNRLMARIQTGNARARRLLEACGFQPGGLLPDVTRDGEPRPCILYARNRAGAE